MRRVDVLIPPSAVTRALDQEETNVSSIAADEAHAEDDDDDFEEVPSLLKLGYEEHFVDPEEGWERLPPEAMQPQPTQTPEAMQQQPTQPSDQQSETQSASSSSAPWPVTPKAISMPDRGGGEATAHDNKISPGRRDGQMIGISSESSAEVAAPDTTLTGAHVASSSRPPVRAARSSIEKKQTNTRKLLLARMHPRNRSAFKHIDAM